MKTKVDGYSEVESLAGELYQTLLKQQIETRFDGGRQIKINKNSHKKGLSELHNNQIIKLREQS